MNTNENNLNNIRTIAVMLNANINNMCNASTTEDVTQEFIQAKDRLVELFKINVERTSR